MVYTKKTNKNSLNSWEKFAWIYKLLIIFIAIGLIGLGGYYLISQEPEYNFKQLGDWKINPNKNELISLLSSVRDTQKTVKWTLSDESKRKKLTKKEKKATKGKKKKK